MKTMKVLTLFYLSALCFFCNSANAQIVFEHTITHNDYRMTYEFNTHNETMYYNFSHNSNIINIYKADFSLYKTITINPPSGYYIHDVNNFSSKLFNDDNLLEFIVVLSSGTYNRKMTLYNEDLNVIMDFGNKQYAHAYTTMDNQTKLMVFGLYLDGNNANYTESDIYRLPGTIPNPNPSDANDIIQEQKSNPPFPNPASSFVILPYSLKQNESSTMRIFNAAGQLKEIFQINGTTDRLNVSTEKYSSGIYIYEYNGLTNTFIVN